MLRLAQEEADGHVGAAHPAKLPPLIDMDDYLGSKGKVVVGNAAPLALSESLLYRLSYFRFAHEVSQYGKPPGFDRVRQVYPPLPPFPSL